MSTRKKGLKSLPLFRPFGLPDRIKLISWHAGINLLGPEVNPSFEVLDFFKPGFSELLDGFSAPATHFAMDYNLVGAIQLMHARRDLTQRNQDRVGQAADFIFVRLTNIHDGEIIPPIQPGFELSRRDLEGTLIG